MGKVQPLGETVAKLLLESDLTMSLPHPESCCFFAAGEWRLCKQQKLLALYLYLWLH